MSTVTFLTYPWNLATEQAAAVACSQNSELSDEQTLQKIHSYDPQDQCRDDDDEKEEDENDNNGDEKEDKEDKEGEGEGDDDKDEGEVEEDEEEDEEIDGATHDIHMEERLGYHRLLIRCYPPSHHGWRRAIRPPAIALEYIPSISLFLPL